MPSTDPVAVLRPAQVLKYYTQSIRLGYRHIYKSLPRLLTLWYDFGTQNPNACDKKVRSPLAWQRSHMPQHVD